MRNRLWDGILLTPLIVLSAIPDGGCRGTTAQRTTSCMERMIEIRNQYSRVSIAPPETTPEMAVLALKDFFDPATHAVGKPTSRVFVEIDECQADSIFATCYPTGFASEPGLADDYFFLQDFTATANGLEPGMTKDQVIEILGAPFGETAEILVYAIRDEAAELHEPQGSLRYRNGVRLFFAGGRLSAIWIEVVWSC